MKPEMLDDILKLPERDRIKLIGLLHTSLNSEIENVDKVWVKEAENRLDQYYSSEIKTKSISDIKQKLNIY